MGHRLGGTWDSVIPNSPMYGGSSSWPAAPRGTPGWWRNSSRRSTCRLPVEVDIASEFRYRNPVIGPATLLIAISQSGETADTLAACGRPSAEGLGQLPSATLSILP